MISRQTLQAAIDTELRTDAFKDYTVNGLQVEGRESIGRVLTGVTACQALLDEAVAWGADAVLVHHGYFWKNEPVSVTGMKRRRFATLLSNDLNLLAYHLPLDAHLTLGNNACLGRRLGFEVERCLDGELGQGLLWMGKPDTELDSRALAARIEQALGRTPLLIEGHSGTIRNVAWCTGGAQDMLPLAAEAGADVFISGEVSERTTHMAREMGITYLAAGHHATERDGIQALGEWLKSRFDVEHRFVDIDNPA
ncbi:MULTISPECIES: Nif3-like dinuclear metal center hexameric protein [Salinicola]|jgi:dinuclear metal center YbgI/SA1388 family protein|uniref:Nif3-like dinuclear metal center hexameric protein n=1 Tax=Salinicola TaxID=404432 RepID=UPI000B3FE887|nr:Nif3-like dinuclear metal center hexameric protein [Salinicola salarius]MEC8916563.1 Nif3-like dinuclear metal center hexameric protein [Pseudomonadota bacterium]